jgi:deoxyribodipyrimidine photolyase-related protein
MGTALICILGDQLTHGRGALKDAIPGRDSIVMAEVTAEACYVKHNRHKIALIFSAMRHFCRELRSMGFSVHYFEYSSRGPATLLEAAEAALLLSPADEVRCCEPGEHRLREEIAAWNLPVPVHLIPDDRFLCSEEEFQAWADGRKQLRMEYFYREMRRKYRILLEENGKPAGGSWNFDAQNRRGWRARESVPARPTLVPDCITAEVIELVNREFPDHPGNLDLFYLATTSQEANVHFDWFLQHCLGLFGTYQDALAEESPWLFHSLVSMYLNIGLLDPLDVCLKVERAWQDGRCGIAAAEGFIRQILGWREYVRGIYWCAMPEYARRNTLNAKRPMPEWFWDGDTDMRCLEVALRQTLDLGYAHHIQRLMVIGNFALLAGLDVEQVCSWYLAVYVDAFEWVELPNTLGMALYADDGMMASKPYAASGKYIQRQGNHCKKCRYSPTRVAGDGACPFNALYWYFLSRHEHRLKDNPRMSMVLGNWSKKADSEKTEILVWAKQELERLAPEWTP